MIFLKSIEISIEMKNIENLCNMLDELVMEVGVENVLIVFDNAITYLVGRLIKVRQHML